MILRITGKLASKINVKPHADVPSAENPFVEWAANLVEIRRKNFILLTHATTFYSTLFPAGRLGNMGTFAVRLIETLAVVLHEQKLGHVFDQLIVPDLKPFLYATCPDRTLIGRMRQVLTLARDMDDVALSTPYWPTTFLNSIVYTPETGLCPASVFTAAIPPDCEPGPDPEPDASFSA
ncbi:MAG: hypothetical protein RI897_845 [Verrucomicrobiota bacterium]|jgi:hypothetical protein